LKPGLARRVDSGLEPGRVEEKIRKGKTRHDPATRLTRSKTWLQPVDFFLLKRCRFDFKKKKRIDPGDPVKTQNPGLGSSRV
jgi:hypothetical protein